MWPGQCGPMGTVPGRASAAWSQPGVGGRGEKRRCHISLPSLWPLPDARPLAARSDRPGGPLPSYRIWPTYLGAGLREEEGTQGASLRGQLAQGEASDGAPGHPSACPPGLLPGPNLRVQ